MVRKLFAISLLALFIFNIVGYKIMVMMEEQKADANLEALIDKNSFQNADLFTLKIPLNLPYQASQVNFERVDGEITINNETYKYVQRKISNDTLYLQCIRHTEKINLQQKANDYFAKLNDSGSNNLTAKNSSGKHTAVTKYTSQDFVDDFNGWDYAVYLSASISYPVKYFIKKGSGHLQLLLKPPQSV